MRRRRKFSDREDPRRNRGEIACRIMRTAKLVGIGTVAVYSDVDRGSLHVKSADEVVRIGPPLARSSYLNASAIIDAVIRTGAQGIRIVHGPNEFVESAMGAQREAAASFGVNTILLEKYITRPRHIEVQVFGDKHGNVLHLYEHDCSVQRRRQKIIEEAPAPNVTNEFRRLIGEAAVSAAKDMLLKLVYTLKMFLKDFFLLLEIFTITVLFQFHQQFELRREWKKVILLECIMIQ